jgi:hypothetical protein
MIQYDRIKASSMVDITVWVGVILFDIVEVFDIDNLVFRVKLRLWHCNVF